MEENFGYDVEGFVPSKQHRADEELYHDRNKKLPLFLHSRLGFPFLVVNGSGDGKKAWVPYTVLRCLKIDMSGQMESRDQNCNALLRFWYPPKLNERHVTQYPFLLIV